MTEEQQEEQYRKPRELDPRMKDEIREAVISGIQAAMGDPKTWEAAVTAWKSQAKTAAGGLMFEGVHKMALAITAVLAVYALGGWSAVVKFIKGY